MICGMNAETTLTLQTMGLTLAGVETALSLEQALELQGVEGPAPELREPELDLSDLDVGADSSEAQASPTLKRRPT